MITEEKLIIRYYVKVVENANEHYREGISNLGTFTAVNDRFWKRWSGNDSEWMVDGLCTSTMKGNSFFYFDIPTATFRNLVGAGFGIRTPFAESEYPPEIHVLDIGCGIHSFWNQLKTGNCIRGHYHGIDIKDLADVRNMDDLGSSPLTTVQNVFQPPEPGYVFQRHNFDVFEGIHDLKKDFEGLKGKDSILYDKEEGDIPTLYYLPSDQRFNIVMIDVESHGNERLLYELAYPHLARVHLVALSCIGWMGTGGPCYRRIFERFIRNHPRVNVHFVTPEAEHPHDAMRDMYVVCEKKGTT